jgi:DNA polymerase III subunit beta
MKFYCSQKDLDRAVGIVNKAIGSNNTLPVLNNILVKAEGKRVYFASTNLEIAIKCSIEADVRGEGAITVPAKLLSNYIALVSDEKIEMSVLEGNTLSVSSSSSNTKIKCISSDEFPLIPEAEKGVEVFIKAQDFHNSIDETVFAASLNLSRPVLSGVLFSLKGKEVTLVATDSYRLAEKKIVLTDSSEEEIYCIIPARTVTELSKIIARAEEEKVKINVSQNQILFSVDGIELVSRLIEGRFPDYQKIIPTGTPTTSTVSVEDLSLVLKRVSLFARENNNNISISVTNDGKMSVSSEETKVGEEKAEVSIQIEGENKKISLNAQYLIDVLTHINNDKVLFQIIDKVSPAMIRPAGKEDYVYIIMPLKV